MLYHLCTLICGAVAGAVVGAVAGALFASLDYSKAAALTIGIGGICLGAADLLFVLSTFRQAFSRSQAVDPIDVAINRECGLTLRSTGSHRPGHLQASNAICLVPDAYICFACDRAVKGVRPCRPRETRY